MGRENRDNVRARESGWTLVWAAPLVLWVFFAIIADALRAECTVDIHCGPGSCVSNRCACDAPELDLAQPFPYRCGNNTDVVTNWADWTSSGLGVFGAVVFLAYMCAFRDSTRRAELGNADEATRADLVVLALFLVFFFLGIALLLVSTLKLPQGSRMPLSVVAFACLALSLLIVFCAPGHEPKHHHDKKEDDEEMPRSASVTPGRRRSYKP